MEKVLCALEVNRGWFEENNVKLVIKLTLRKAEKMLATIKSNHVIVWPSAYASGALVKCRKKGAANWGNKAQRRKKQKLVKHVGKVMKRKGMKTMFGKRYPNCVKKTKKERS